MKNFFQMSAKTFYGFEDILCKELKKINAIGKSSKGFRYDSGYIKTQPLAFSSINRNDVKKALHKVRSSGSVSPAKKGFYKLIR